MKNLSKILLMITATTVGNMTYYSDGTTAQQIGNLTYFSNPSTGKNMTCQTIGTQTYCN